MVPRARHLLAAATAGIVLRILVACSTSGQPAVSSSDDGPPGEAFTACEINGYFSESEGGICPDGTCPVLAFDTNGGLLACCTSVVSGPGRCVDGAGPGLPDASEAAAEAGDADAGESVPDAPNDVAEVSSPSDAADE